MTEKPKKPEACANLDKKSLKKGLVYHRRQLNLIRGTWQRLKVKNKAERQQFFRSLKQRFWAQGVKEKQAEKLRDRTLINLENCEGWLTGKEGFQIKGFTNYTLGALLKGLNIPTLRKYEPRDLARHGFTNSTPYTIVRLRSDGEYEEIAKVDEDGDQTDIKRPRRTRIIGKEIFVFEPVSKKTKKVEEDEEKEEKSDEDDSDEKKSKTEESKKIQKKKRKEEDGKEEDEDEKPKSADKDKKEKEEKKKKKALSITPESRPTTPASKPVTKLEEKKPKTTELKESPKPEPKPIEILKNYLQNKKIAEKYAFTENAKDKNIFIFRVPLKITDGNSYIIPPTSDLTAERVQQKDFSELNKYIAKTEIITSLTQKLYDKLNLDNKTRFIFFFTKNGTTNSFELKKLTLSPTDNKKTVEEIVGTGTCDPDLKKIVFSPKAKNSLNLTEEITISSDEDDDGGRGGSESKKPSTTLPAPTSRPTSEVRPVERKAPESMPTSRPSIPPWLETYRTNIKNNLNLLSLSPKSIEIQGTSFFIVTYKPIYINGTKTRVILPVGKLNFNSVTSNKPHLLTRYSSSMEKIIELFTRLSKKISLPKNVDHEFKFKGSYQNNFDKDSIISAPISFSLIKRGKSADGSTSENVIAEGHYSEELKSGGDSSNPYTKASNKIVASLSITDKKTQKKTEVSSEDPNDTDTTDTTPSDSPPLRRAEVPVKREKPTTMPARLDSVRKEKQASAPEESGKKSPLQKLTDKLKELNLDNNYTATLTDDNKVFLQILPQTLNEFQITSKFFIVRLQQVNPDEAPEIIRRLKKSKSTISINTVGHYLDPKRLKNDDFTELNSAIATDKKIIDLVSKIFPRLEIKQKEGEKEIIFFFSKNGQTLNIDVNETTKSDDGKVNHKSLWKGSCDPEANTITLREVTTGKEVTEGQEEE